MTDPGETPGRLTLAIERIDAANAEDPNRIDHAGSSHVKELLHAEMMTEWVLRLDPGATETQLIAARAHHFRRWTRPRSDFPEGRAGYLRWRTAAKKDQAAEVGAILAEVGYSADDVDRVGQIIRKERLATDPAVQTHEDALCMVFLLTQLDDLAERLGDDETVTILVKTIAKLSPAGVEAALGLELADPGRALLGRAVEQVATESHIPD